jgi:hypothetical protein
MNLSGTSSVAPCLPLTSEEQLDYDRINTALYWLNNKIPTALSGAGIICNSIFLYFVIKGMYEKCLTSKIYPFMVNKSIGDLLSSIATCLVPNVLQWRTAPMSTDRQKDRHTNGISVYDADDTKL